MITIGCLRAGIAAGALVMACGAYGDATSATEHGAALDRIRADYRADRAACDDLKGNAKDVCRERAIGKGRIARATLKRSGSDGAIDLEKVAIARSDSDYAVGKQICNAVAGDARRSCMAAAEVTHARSLLEAESSRMSGASRKNGAEGTRDANSRVVEEKCETLIPDRQASCVSGARIRFDRG